VQEMIRVEAYLRQGLQFLSYGGQLRLEHVGRHAHDARGVRAAAAVPPRGVVASICRAGSARERVPHTAVRRLEFRFARHWLR
jgi:hypothetical protein